jgi:hypothetical protein
LLAGFMPEGEAIQRAADLSLEPPEPAGASALRARLRCASQHVASLPPRALADIERGPLPPEWSDHLRALESEPTFVEHLAGARGHRFAWIDLCGVVSAQQRVDGAQVEALAATAPPVGDDGLLRMCLPLEARAVRTPLAMVLDQQSNEVRVETDGDDLRILGIVEGEDPAAGRTWAGFLFGAGLAQIGVVHVEGRYILRNGYHRACALLHAGHRVIPALVIEANSLAAAELVQPGFFSAERLFGPVPPLVADFLGPAAVEVPRPATRLVLTLRAEIRRVAEPSP